MPPELTPTSKGELLDQLAGLTGIGWTVSILGFLSAVLDIGPALVERLGPDPESLLAVGVALFVATAVLDRLRRSVTDGE